MSILKKVSSGFKFLLNFLADIVSAISHNALSCLIGGFIIWVFKGFKTKLNEEIIEEYSYEEPFYKRFVKPQFVGFIFLCLMLFVFGLYLSMIKRN